MAKSSLSLFERLFSSKRKREKLSQEQAAHDSEASVVTDTVPEPSPVAAPVATPAVPAETIGAVISPDATDVSVQSVAPVVPVPVPQPDLAEQPQATAPDAVATPVAVAEQPTAVEAEGFAGLSDEGLAPVAPAVESSQADVQSPADAVETASSGSETADPDGGDQDTELEYDSMVLLSKLEQLVIRLSDNAVQKSMPLVVEAMGELLNHLAEFSEQLPVAENQKLSLSALIERDAQDYAQLRADYVQNNRLVLGDAEAGFGQEPESFQQFSNDILRVVNVYLSASVKAFSSPRVGEQWKTLYTGFFVNLSKAVRSAQDIQNQQ